MIRTKRKTAIEERYYEIKRRQINFVEMVQERASKMKTSFTAFLPNDLIFQILLLMPIKSIFRFNCVCKSWNMLIHSAEFVEAYNTEAQTRLILLRPIKPDRFNTFHVETQVKQSVSFSIFPYSPKEMQTNNVINCLEIEDGKGKIVDLNISCFGSIVATCNGLVLIASMFDHKTDESGRMSMQDRSKLNSHERPGKLIIMNPMTRKFLGFPLGTLPSRPRRYFHNGRGEGESYGLVFSYAQKVYKVVHCFKDELGHIGCEIWNTETRYWKAIDGPSEDPSKCLRSQPIWASGALHWLSYRYDHHHHHHHHHQRPSDYIVSMGAENEKFSVTKLPGSIGRKEKLVEMGGLLSYVSTLDMNHIEVWVLKGLDGSGWIKQHTIHFDAVVGDVENKEYFVPVLAVNAKEMIFKRRNVLYSYDFDVGEVKVIEMEDESISGKDILIPHTNNLATWEPLEPMS